MKKWLDDLYVILLKRGLPTLDNSLKNYNDNQEIIDNMKRKETSIIEVASGDSFTINLNDHIKINDFVYLFAMGKSSESDINFNRVSCISLFRLSSLYYVAATVFSMNEVSLTRNNNILTITNNSNITIYFKVRFNSLA